MSLTSNSILIVLFENNFPTQYLSQNLFNITKYSVLKTIDMIVVGHV